MPMSFPDMKSLERAANAWQFRDIGEDETEIQYRTALADFVQDKDMIESMEIRSGKGWDQFTQGDEIAVLARTLNRNRASDAHLITKRRNRRWHK